MSELEDTGANWVGTPRSVSDRIRDLDKAGHSRAEIARMLGKRYQHVRNVLEADKLKTIPTAQPSAVPITSSTKRFRFVVGADGTLILPPAAQAALGVEPGSVVIGLMQDESMVLTEGRRSALRAQAMAMAMDTGVGSVVDELIADRRAAAAREERG